MTTTESELLKERIEYLEELLRRGIVVGDLVLQSPDSSDLLQLIDWLTEVKTSLSGASLP